MTRSELMRGTHLFGKLESTCARQSLSEVTHGQRRTDAEQESILAQKKGLKVGKTSSF